MDLSISPDIPAYWAYLIVLALGFFAAVRQVHQRLASYEAIWLVPGTWLLLILYLAVPLILFWLLDRTGAVRDTSLFAALLVGGGYERILAGAGQSGITADQGILRLWDPFLAYADRLASGIGTRLFVISRRLKQRLVTHVLEDPDGKLERLKELALRMSERPDSLQRRLQSANQKERERAELLYEEVSSHPGFMAELREAQLIDRWWRLLHDPRIHSAIIRVGVAGLAVGVLIWAAVQLDTPRTRVGFHVWRLAKANVSAADLFRTRRSLTGLLADPASSAATLDAIVRTLQQPALKSERVDLALEVLLATRCEAPVRELRLPSRLAHALHARNADTRRRIHETLLFLGDGETGEPIPMLQQWKPGRGDSPVRLQQRIDAWLGYWSPVPAAAAGHMGCPDPPLGDGGGRAASSVSSQRVM